MQIVFRNVVRVLRETVQFSLENPDATAVVTLAMLTCYHIGKIAGLVEANR